MGQKYKIYFFLFLSHYVIPRCKYVYKPPRLGVKYTGFVYDYPLVFFIFCMDQFFREGACGLSPLFSVFSKTSGLAPFHHQLLYIYWLQMCFDVIFPRQEEGFLFFSDNFHFSAGRNAGIRTWSRCLSSPCGLYQLATSCFCF